jgi:hypothetical protein
LTIIKSLVLPDLMFVTSDMTSDMTSVEIN